MNRKEFDSKAMTNANGKKEKFFVLKSGIDGYFRFIGKKHNVPGGNLFMFFKFIYLNFEFEDINIISINYVHYANHTEFSIKTIKKMVAILETENFLEYIGKIGKFNSYTLAIPENFFNLCENFHDEDLKFLSKNKVKNQSITREQILSSKKITRELIPSNSEINPELTDATRELIPSNSEINPELNSANNGTINNYSDSKETIKETLYKEISKEKGNFFSCLPKSLDFLEDSNNSNFDSTEENMDLELDNIECDKSTTDEGVIDNSGKNPATGVGAEEEELGYYPLDGIKSKSSTMYIEGNASINESRKNKSDEPVQYKLFTDDEIPEDNKKVTSYDKLKESLSDDYTKKIFGNLPEIEKGKDSDIPVTLNAGERKDLAINLLKEFKTMIREDSIYRNKLLKLCNENISIEDITELLKYFGSKLITEMFRYVCSSDTIKFNINSFISFGFRCFNSYHANIIDSMKKDGFAVPENVLDIIIEKVKIKAEKEKTEKKIDKIEKDVNKLWDDKGKFIGNTQKEESENDDETLSIDEIEALSTEEMLLKFREKIHINGGKTNQSGNLINMIYKVTTKNSSVEELREVIKEHGNRRTYEALMYLADPICNYILSVISSGGIICLMERLDKVLNNKSFIDSKLKESDKTGVLHPKVSKDFGFEY